MQKIEADYNQQWFLPPRVEDWVPEGHPARFIREIVDGMDLEALGFARQLPVEGRPPYANELLLRVWLFGYWERIRSSRKLEKACRRDLAFIWLCGNHAPDHNTLWRFFRDNKKALRVVFKQTVRVAIEMNLVGLVVQAVDGTKLQAACSGSKGFDRKSLETLLGRLDGQIAEIEAMIEKENHQTGTDEPSLPEKLHKREALRARVAEALGKIDDGQTKHCCPTEQDARRMKCDGKNRFGHNAQAMVDGKNQVIVAIDVVNDATDSAQLVPMLKQAVANTGCTTVTTLADGGYASGEQFEAAAQLGCDVLGKLPASSKNPHENPYHASNFSYDESSDTFVCPQGRHLPFLRTRRKWKKSVKVYRSTAVCGNCPVRKQCTKDRHGRTIELQPGRAEIERMRVKLTDEQNQQLLKQRGRIVEPVFAQIKQNDGFRRWTLYGLENVRTQWALLCSTWNLRKIFQTWFMRQGNAPVNAATCLRRRQPQHLFALFGKGCCAPALRSDWFDGAFRLSA